jgi:hypothetical protein
VVFAQTVGTKPETTIRIRKQERTTPRLLSKTGLFSVMKLLEPSREQMQSAECA